RRRAALGRGRRRPHLPAPVGDLVRRRPHPCTGGAARTKVREALMLYVFALLDQRVIRLGTAFDGGRVTCVVAEGITLPVQRRAAPPPLDAATLAEHDRMVRRIAESANAVLPMRFGVVVRDRRDLAQRLAGHAPAIREALARVAGCDQMTLRVYVDD